MRCHILEPNTQRRLNDPHPLLLRLNVGLLYLTKLLISVIEMRRKSLILLIPDVYPNLRLPLLLLLYFLHILLVLVQLIVYHVDMHLFRIVKAEVPRLLGK